MQCDSSTTRPDDRSNVQGSLKEAGAGWAVDVVLRERHNGHRGREFYQCAFPIFSEAEKAVAKLYDSRRVLLVAAAEPLTPDAVQRLSLQPGEVRRTA